MKFMIIKDLKDAGINSGGKAAGLAKLIKLGVNVPDGFVIEKSMNLDYALLREKLPSLGDFLAIRSSAYGEDSSDKSFAGVFESYLNIENDFNEVIDKINLINESNKNGKQYDSEYNGYMNVIVQNMVEPLISGVLFTKAFDLDGSEVAFIDYTKGLGDKLVGGLVNGNQLIVKKSGNELDFSSARNSDIDTSIFEPINKELRKLDLSVGLDIEFCISKDLKAYLLQARPITSKLLIQENMEIGIVTSGGYAEGKVYVIKNDSDNKEREMIEKFPDGGILVTEISGYTYEPALRRARAVITEEGSVLSHASIVARELGIPCIAGVKDATELFKTGDDIIIDVDKKRIFLNNNEVVLSSKEGLEYAELFCFDRIKSFVYNGYMMLVESTPDGIILHIGLQHVDKETLKDIDLMVRKAQGFPVVINRNYKFNWYFNIMKFKSLPYFKDMVNYVKEIIKDLDYEKLKEFYSRVLNMVTELHDIDLKKSLKKKLIVYEMVSACNILLYGIIPMGYAVRYCYEESYNILKKLGKNFNDLLSGNFDYQSNDELKRIHDFMDVVSMLKIDEKDNVKVRFPGFIGVDLNKLVFEYFKEAGIENTGYLLDTLYDNLNSGDFDFIREKFPDDFYKKSSKQKMIK